MFLLAKVLVLYLTYFLGLSKDGSSAIYHAYIGFCYFTPVFGAILAESYWGIYKTILWLSLVNLTGFSLMAVSAIPFDGSRYGHNS